MTSIEEIKQTAVQYNKVARSIPDLINQSGIKKKDLYEKLGISKAEFFRRMNCSHLWPLQDFEKLVNVLTTLQK